MSCSIVPVRSERHLDDVRTLFREYADSLEIDLTFQGFEAELAGLPGRYGLPEGELFLAYADSGGAIGCVGVRGLDVAGAGEIKRLYVREAGRGLGLGRALAETALRFAEEAGYRRVMLDTMPSMTAAIALYRALGFERTEPYSRLGPPAADFVYFAKRLGPA